jgi:hypothetical protein
MAGPKPMRIPRATECRSPSASDDNRCRRSAGFEIPIQVPALARDVWICGRLQSRLSPSKRAASAAKFDYDRALHGS